MTELPILYSFRRCPYAMRARMALLTSDTPVRLREVILRDKPQEMLEASPKATVPVMVLFDGEVLDESLDVMHWALARNDPKQWLKQKDKSDALIVRVEDDFKRHLDRYKYPNRYEGADPLFHRGEGLKFLQQLDGQIAQNGQLLGEQESLADQAIFPFIRQFANHDRTWFDMQDIPALQKWLTGHLASDIFVATMTKYPQWKTGDVEPVFSA
ncbi:Glutathione S-transferase domain protein [hydrothermal vent metagenome]|uniref:Glutathione S-transferase domain protein n=1 Tax=hydrothermal vent metagenome TaxID=652676 RepID=A0A3B0R859_9ZZZZ